MLIYRRKDLEEAVQSKSEPKIPAHLVEEMEGLNKTMEEVRISPLFPDGRSVAPPNFFFSFLQERARYIEKQNDVDVLVYSTLHLKILGGVLRKEEDLNEAMKVRARQLITFKKDTPLKALKEEIVKLFGNGMYTVGSNV